ncbi:helix-turn-helix transcriptional regulator [Nocardioides conyzicola]|uniref:HigA2-like helix-turn-helix domain-containing protein n=1 Tax=Nocardioides conyzicola TaxID=1651781 RepID=A0ABP8XBP2_9ACTN
MPRRPTIKAATVRGPRLFLRYPDEFGVADPAEPAPLPPSQRYKAQAALVQHELARQVTEQMPRLGLTYPELAEHVGVSVEQLRRLLRGESAMSVERMQRLASAAGLRMTVRVERSE